MIATVVREVVRGAHRPDFNDHAFAGNLALDFTGRTGILIMDGFGCKFVAPRGQVVIDHDQIVEGRNLNGTIFDHGGYTLADTADDIVATIEASVFHSLKEALRSELWSLAMGDPSEFTAEQRKVFNWVAGRKLWEQGPLPRTDEVFDIVYRVMAAFGLTFLQRILVLRLLNIL